MIEFDIREGIAGIDIKAPPPHRVFPGLRSGLCSIDQQKPAWHSAQLTYRCHRCLCLHCRRMQWAHWASGLLGGPVPVADRGRFRRGGGALCVPLVDCPAGSGIAKVEVLAIVN